MPSNACGGCANFVVFFQEKPAAESAKLALSAWGEQANLTRDIWQRIYPDDAKEVDEAVKKSKQNSQANRNRHAAKISIGTA
ncbi:MAG: hypothetical protein KDA87_24190 [Planctomycetales bacterium]|nr:hypothetical protein [Planctomycetales bacterium]